MTGVGDRIRSIRGTKTQKAFADSLGISTQAVINYERHGRTPKQQVLNKISNVYGINVDWLLTGTGVMFAPPSRVERAGEKTADMSAVLNLDSGQGVENKESGTCKTADMSAVLPQELTTRCLRLADENAALLRENGDLRVEVERLRMNIERRDSRIAELERQLVEALKPCHGKTVLEQGGAVAG